MSVKKTEIETKFGLPKQAKDKILKDALSKCDAITDKLACEEIMRFCLNTLLMSVSKVLSGVSKEDFSQEHRVHLVSTIVADVETLIMPVVSSLLDKDPEKGTFDGTRLARETNTIRENETFHVEHKSTDAGQEMRVSIGTEMPREVAEFMENFDENTIVGNS